MIVAAVPVWLVKLENGGIHVYNFIIVVGFVWSCFNER